MKLHKAARRWGCEINMTAMIDIVFQLIIFFMVTTQFVKVEVESLTLPEAAKQSATPPPAMGKLTVNVHADGRMVLLGQTYTPDLFRALLAEQLLQRRPEDAQVLIRADRAAPWDKVGRLMHICALQGISQVRVATLEPGSAAAP